MSKGQKKVMVTDYLFGENPVRVSGTALVPLFAAKDVCDVLGLKNSRTAIEALDDDELRKLKLRSRAGDTWFVTESGLYHLIFKSRKVAAKKFRRWVTDEVLPALRADGRYVVTAREPEAVKDKELLTLPEWLEELEVDLVEKSWLAQRLLDRARTSAVQMGYDTGKKNGAGGLERFPRAVLNYAVGMVKFETLKSGNAVWIDYFPPGFLKEKVNLLPQSAQ